ncbi:MAG: hypothetical protein QXT31_07430 [Candidatus Bathyarchaeia archaeon]
MKTFEKILIIFLPAILMIILLLGVSLLLINKPNISSPHAGIIYINIYGHRDKTPLHKNLHANIVIDGIEVSNSPIIQTKFGKSIMDMGKWIKVDLTISMANSIVYQKTFTETVDIGAQWQHIEVITLPSGQYTIYVSGIDKDGYKSQAFMNLVI